MRRAVFLDRDGVINQIITRDGRPVGPERLEDFVILPRTREAVEAFRAAGYLVIVATNQPNARPGGQARQIVDAMHELLRSTLPVDDIKVCYHIDADNCNCRKPKPGLLLQAAVEHQISFVYSWMIGDRWRDIAAGRTVGCRTAFIDYGYSEPRPDSPDIVVPSLVEAVQFVIEKPSMRY